MKTKSKILTDFKNWYPKGVFTWDLDFEENQFIAKIRKDCELNRQSNQLGWKQLTLALENLGFRVFET